MSILHKKDNPKPTLVVSHERSGTHLMLNSLGENNCVNVPIGNNKLINKFLKEYQGEQILKSHHPSYYFDDFVFDKYNVVYVSRNPLDVMTSMFFYHKSNMKAFPQHNSIEEFVFSSPYTNDDYSNEKPKHYLERWVNHIKSYKEKNVIWVTYEEIVSDFPLVKKRMNDLNIFCEDTKPVFPYIRDVNGRFIRQGKGQYVSPRKGIIGDHVNHMSPQLIGRINEYIDMSLF